MRPKIDWWLLFFGALAIGNGIGWNIALRRLERVQKILTKTVEECSDGWPVLPPLPDAEGR